MISKLASRSIKKYRIFIVTKYILKVSSYTDSFKQGIEYQTMVYPGKKYKLQVPMKKDCFSSIETGNFTGNFSWAK